MYQPPPSPHAAPKKKLTRRAKLLIAAGLVAAAVPFTLGGIQGARSLATQQASAGHNAAGATSASPHAHAAATPSKTPRPCRTPVRDVIERFKEPGEPWVAQELGDEGTAPCTFLPAPRVVRQWNGRMPRTPGTCTQLAWRSANPRYNVDATPAKPLRRVFDQVGPAC